jgi:hypothetical protein
MFQQQQQQQPPPSSSSSSRVLLFGDSGVGKSLLLRQLSALLCRGRADVPLDHIEPTIGYRIEAVPMKRNTSTTTAINATVVHIIDLVEVGGNRSLVMGSGSRLQPLVGSSSSGSTLIDAVIFVYDENSARSMVSLATWYRECVSAGVVQGCKAIALIGVVVSTPTQHRPQSLPSSGLTHQCSSFVQAESSVSPGTGTSSSATPLMSLVKSLYNNPHQALSLAAGGRGGCSSSLSSSSPSPSATRQVLIWCVQTLLHVEHLFLFLCSCLLFGLGQTQVDFRQVTPKEALALVKSDGRCISTIEGLVLGASSEEFEDNATELLHFLSHL